MCGFNFFSHFLLLNCFSFRTEQLKIHEGRCLVEIVSLSYSQNAVQIKL
jgi:hypothetical protein